MKTFTYFQITVFVSVCLWTTVQPQSKPVFQRCSANSECPPHSACRPYSCLGYMCICDQGYVVSRDRYSCLIAGNVSDTCNADVKCLGGVYAYCGGGVCKCLSFARITELNTCVSRSSAMVVGATCTTLDTCVTNAECTGGTCQCSLGYRQRTPDEFWTNPESRKECVLDTYSLDSCNGVKLPTTTPEPTTSTTSTSSSASSTVEPPEQSTSATTTATTTSTTVATTTTMTTDPRTSVAPTTQQGVLVGENCTSSSECPDNASCRPNGCLGVNCLCLPGYAPTFDKTTCLRAGSIGTGCDSNVRCLTLYSYCNNGLCDCMSFFRKTTLNTCTTQGSKVVGESCTLGQNECGLFAECNNSSCVCQDGYRLKTSEEFWSNPDEILECVPAAFSLVICNGEPVTPTHNETTVTYTIPSTSTTPATQTTAATTTTQRPIPALPISKNRDASYDWTPAFAIEVSLIDQIRGLSVFTNDRPGFDGWILEYIIPGFSRLSISINQGEVKVNVIRGGGAYSPSIRERRIRDNCTSTSQCPENASCRPNGCQGVNCLCLDGFAPTFDGTQCLTASIMGTPCDDSVRCLSLYAHCSNGVCDCMSFFRRTDFGTCTTIGSRVVGESCSEGFDECGLFAECRNQTCNCQDGFRWKTSAEYWSDPDSTTECVPMSFSLETCMTISSSTIPSTTLDATPSSTTTNVSSTVPAASSTPASVASSTAETQDSTTNPTPQSSSTSPSTVPTVSSTSRTTEDPSISPTASLVTDSVSAQDTTPSTTAASSTLSPTTTGSTQTTGDGRTSPVSGEPSSQTDKTSVENTAKTSAADENGTTIAVIASSVAAGVILLVIIVVVGVIICKKQLRYKRRLEVTPDKTVVRAYDNGAYPLRTDPSRPDYIIE